MRVIIVGGGIGGLTAAVSLRKQGYTVKIYERVTEMRPIGAGISVWSNGVKVLNALGLGKEIASVGGMMESMSYRKFDDGENYCDFPLEPLYSKVHQRAYPTSRTQLQRILLVGAGKENIQLASRVIDYETTDEGVTVILENGERDTADFLVVADGTHSKLRNKICQKEIPRKYVGYVNWNGPVLTSEMEGYVETSCWTQFVGEGKRVSMMPMGDGGKFYFYFDASPVRSTPPPPSSTTTTTTTLPPPKPDLKAELLSFFGHWHPAVVRLISVVDPSKIARAEIHDTDPLPTLIDSESGRVVLIGDAAHATAPDLGQGGCQAMEDAFVIASLLKGAVGDGMGFEGVKGKEKLKGVCERYQELRGERVKNLVLRARKRADMTHGLSERGMEATKEWYEELKTEETSRGEGIIGGMLKTIEGIPESLEQALVGVPEALP